MSIPKLVLTIGASLGVGVVSAPVIGAALSQPITGAVVPTRIIDLAGYLTSTSRGLGRQGKVRGLENEDLQQSTIDDTNGEDPNTQQSIGSVTSAQVGNRPTTVSGSTAPNGGPKVTATSGPTSDNKRLLAAASFGGALALTVGSFFLIRRVLG